MTLDVVGSLQRGFAESSLLADDPKESAHAQLPPTEAPRSYNESSLTASCPQLYLSRTASRPRAPIAAASVWFSSIHVIASLIAIGSLGSTRMPAPIGSRMRLH